MVPARVVRVGCSGRTIRGLSDPDSGTTTQEDDDLRRRERFVPSLEVFAPGAVTTVHPEEGTARDLRLRRQYTRKVPIKSRRRFCFVLFFSPDRFEDRDLSQFFSQFTAGDDGSRDGESTHGEEVERNLTTAKVHVKQL